MKTLALVAAAVVVGLLWAVDVEGRPAGADIPSGPGPIQLAFQRLYNFDFNGSLSVLESAGQAEPQNPLVPSVRAVTYLFMELDRLKVLESRFFMNDENMKDGGRHPVPDPGLRARLFYAIDSSRKMAAARLAEDPNDEEALFALCLNGSSETNYAALVERRMWKSVKLQGSELAVARKLVDRTPPCYDAYLSFGAVEYIVGDLPFFVRWLVRYDGIDGNKRKGIEQVKQTARNGRFLAPFARILLVVASIREKKLVDAEQLLNGLVLDFPENPLFRKELAVVADRMRMARR